MVYGLLLAETHPAWDDPSARARLLHIYPLFNGTLRPLPKAEKGQEGE